MMVGLDSFAFSSKTLSFPWRYVRDRFLRVIHFSVFLFLALLVPFISASCSSEGIVGALRERRESLDVPDDPILNCSRFLFVSSGAYRGRPSDRSQTSAEEPFCLSAF